MGRPGLPSHVCREWWQQIRIGLGWVIFKAAQVSGVPVTTARGWYRDAGGVNPNPVIAASGRYLSFQERQEIALGLAAGRRQTDIARELGCVSS